MLHFLLRIINIFQALFYIQMQPDIVAGKNLRSSSNIHDQDYVKIKEFTMKICTYKII